MLYTKLRNIATGATNGVVFDKNTNPLSLYGQTMVINSLSETVEVSHYQTATFSFGGTHRSFAGRLRVNNLSPVNAGFGSVSLNRQDTNNAYLTATGLFTLNNSTGEFTYGYTGTGVALNQIGFSLGSDLKTVPYVAGDEITFDQFDFNAGTASGNPFYLHPNISFNLRDGGHNTANPATARGREYGIPYFPINNGSYPGTVDMNRFLNTSFLGTTNLVAAANPVILNTDVWKIKLYADKHEFLINNVLKSTTDYKVSYTFHKVDNSNTEITDYTATNVSVSGSQFISVNPVVSFAGLSPGKYRLRVYNQEGIAAFTSRDFFFIINTSAPTCTFNITSNITPVNISVKALGDNTERFLGQTGTNPIVATYRPVTGQGNVCYKITVTDPGGICATSITTTCPPDKPCVISTGGDLLKTKVYADNGDEAVYASIVNNADAIPTITFDGGITWDGTMQVVDSNGVIIVQGVFAGAYYNNGGTYFEINNKEIRIFSDDYPDFPEVGRTFFIRIVNQTNKNCYLEYPFVIPPFDCPPPSNTVWTITQPACNTNAGATTISIPALFGSQTEVLFELNNQTDFNGNNASYNLANSPYWNNTTKVLVLPYNLFVPNSTNTIHLRRLGTGNCYYDYTGSFVVPDCGNPPTANFKLLQPICVDNAVGNVFLSLTNLNPSTNIKVVYCYNDTGTSFNCNKTQFTPDFTVNSSGAILQIPPPISLTSNLIVRLYSDGGMLEKVFVVNRPSQLCQECYNPFFGYSLSDNVLSVNIFISQNYSANAKVLLTVKDSNNITIYEQLRPRGHVSISLPKGDTYTVSVAMENLLTCNSSQEVKYKPTNEILECDKLYYNTPFSLYYYVFSTQENILVKTFTPIELGGVGGTIHDIVVVDNKVYMAISILGDIKVYDLITGTITQLGNYLPSVSLGLKNKNTLITTGHDRQYEGFNLDGYYDGLWEINLTTTQGTFVRALPSNVKRVQGDIVYIKKTNSILFTFTDRGNSSRITNLEYGTFNVLNDILLPVGDYFAIFKYLDNYYTVQAQTSNVYKLNFQNNTAVKDNSFKIYGEPFSIPLSKFVQGAAQQNECENIDACIHPTYKVNIEQSTCSGLIASNATVTITEALNANKVKYCQGDSFTCDNLTCSGGATIVSGSAILSIPPPPAGVSQPYVIRVYNTINGDCDCYTDTKIVLLNKGCDISGAISVANADFQFYFNNSIASTICGEENTYNNLFDFYVKCTTAGMLENTQQSSYLPTYNRYIPTNVPIPNAFVASGLTYSCGGNQVLNSVMNSAFVRFGFNTTRLRNAYPAINVFTFDVYARKTKNQSGTYTNIIRPLVNTFTETTTITQNPPINFVDFGRNPGDPGTNLPIADVIYSGSTFAKIGTLTYNKSANTFTFTP